MLTTIITAPSGKDLYETRERPSDGYLWNDTTNTGGPGWQVAPDEADTKITLTAGTGIYAGKYLGVNTGNHGDVADGVTSYIHDNGASGIVRLTLRSKRLVAGAEISDGVLSSNGLDNLSGDVPDGVATTVLGKLMQVWGAFFYRHKKDATTIKTYRADGTTVNTTQTYTSVTGVDDVGAAS